MNTLTLEKSVLKKIDRKVIIHNEIPIAIVKDNGKIFAFDNRCPHRGGPLFKGSIKKGYISCPLHNWEFNLESGFCSKNNKIKIDQFEVKELKNTIVIKF